MINFLHLMNSLIDRIILFVENIWNSILNSTCIQLFFLIIILVEVSSHVYCFIMQERLIQNLSGMLVSMCSRSRSWLTAIIIIIHCKSHLVFLPRFILLSLPRIINEYDFLLLLNFL